KLYGARVKAREANEGKHSQSYKKLPKYVESLRTIGPTMLKRMFLCFGASKQGFVEGCRPFIGVDGCHLIGPYGGVMLSAISMDGNGGLFHVALAVVE
ncbi:hypothetical protein CFOL_v3_06156, partial [Cephalotus follicularis]